MRYIFTFLIILSFSIVVKSQKHDAVWLLGYSSNPELIYFGGTVIDFNTTPSDIYYEYRDMNLRQVNASICDTAGNLLFYTNGIYIANALNEPMENGTGLNPGIHAQTNQTYGYILDQGAIALPHPENDSIYFLLHMDKELTAAQNSFQSTNVYFSEINMSRNNGIGAVTKKNQVILTDILHKGKLVATKHANGRDWWILIRKYWTNQYYRILLTPSGPTLTDMQIVGNVIPSNSIGQAVFAPDGSIYAHVNVIGPIGYPVYVSIYQFDRCIGELNSLAQFTYVDSASCAGIAISPNNRFLYISSRSYVYQYDLHASDVEASKITVAVYDGFTDPISTNARTTFYLAQMAPDGKIYLNSNNSVRYLHVINEPDSLGLACDFCQHCIELPTLNAFSLPNFPNYRLRHLEGSPCDTLRQPPVAEWAHEPLGMEVAFQDASYHDIRSWHWSFGDGATDTIPNPVHSYAAEGVYNVCLAVSNPRGADTLCREVQVLVSSVAGFDSAGFDFAQPAAAVRVEIWPNPVPSNVPATLIAEGIPASETSRGLREPGRGLREPGRGLREPGRGLREPGRGLSVVEIRDALGRVVLRMPLQVVNGRIRQELDVSSLAAGVYFYEVWHTRSEPRASQDGLHLGGGKLVIVH